MTEVLFVCTANLCRSPMAQALMRPKLVARRVDAGVRSAGTIDMDGAVAPDEVQAALAAYGLDASAHRSHLVAPGDLARADLVVGLAAEHVRHIVVLDPEVWPRAFTLRELVRRGAEVGPRLPGEALEAWLDAAGGDREPGDNFARAGADDIADPIGGPPAGYAAAAAVIDMLLDQLVDLVWPAPD